MLDKKLLNIKFYFKSMYKIQKKVKQYSVKMELKNGPECVLQRENELLQAFPDKDTKTDLTQRNTEYVGRTEKACASREANKAGCVEAGQTDQISRKL